MESIVCKYVDQIKDELTRHEILEYIFYYVNDDELNYWYYIDDVESFIDYIKTLIDQNKIQNLMELCGI
mgnify:CR=1 FL=1